MHLSLWILGFLILAGVPHKLPAESAAGDFSVTRLAPGVFVHQGAHQEISAANSGDIANIGFVIGRDCVAVIDTGGSIEVGKSLRQAIREMTPLPVCYVINTHVHPDHIFGNAAFQDDHPTYIGHERLPDALAARAQHYLGTVSRSLGHLVPSAQIIPPDRTVGGKISLDLGGRTL